MMTAEMAVAQYTPLVLRLAGRHARHGAMDRDDLIQSGFEALIHAARTWRPDGGASFLTYAWLRIRGHLVRVVQSARRRGVRCRKGAPPCPVESLTDPIGDEDGSTLEDVLGLPATQEDAAGAAEVIALVRSRFSERDQQVFDLRLQGLDGEQIGEAIGRSRERVRQILEKIDARVCELGGVPQSSTLARGVSAS